MTRDCRSLRIETEEETLRVIKTFFCLEQIHTNRNTLAVSFITLINQGMRSFYAELSFLLPSINGVLTEVYLSMGSLSRII